MGFLDSLFGRKREPAKSVDPAEIKDGVDCLIAFCRDVRCHAGEEVFVQDGMEKQVLSAYAFGGVHVLSQHRGFSPPQAHAMMLAVLHNYFGYGEENSTVKAQALINATGDKRSSIRAIIHRGIEGFLAWRQDREAFDAADFRNLPATLRQFKPSA
ncbi:MAG: Imm48 family immunity protein [Isosphaeraceae bacterium]